MTELSAADIAFAQSLLIHQDAHVLGFNKPAGLAVQGGAGVARSLEDLLAAFAKSNGKRPRLVHRLDRETSGDHRRAHQARGRFFFLPRSRDARKTYLAIVCGVRPSRRRARSRWR